MNESKKDEALARAEDLPQHVDQPVQLRGIAQEAKGGSVVMLANGTPVYVEDVSGWPDEAVGAEVLVTGRLHHKKFIPDPYVDASGGISQGAYGTQYTLTGTSWSRAE